MGALYSPDGLSEDCAKGLAWNTSEISDAYECVERCVRQLRNKV
jgi:hypothetical protein